MAQSADGFWSVRDVADAMGVSDQTVYNQIRRGELKALHLDGRLFLLEQHILDLVASRRGSAGPDKMAAAIARADQAEAAERNRDNPPVPVDLGDRVPQGQKGGGKVVYQMVTFAPNDGRSGRQVAARARAAIEAAKHAKDDDESTAGDAGRRMTVRRLTTRPVLPDGKVLPQGFRTAPPELPEGTFAEALAAEVPSI
jgi:excisionase family DNA binding protein